MAIEVNHSAGCKVDRPLHRAMQKPEAARPLTMTAGNGPVFVNIAREAAVNRPAMAIEVNHRYLTPAAYPA